MVLGMAFCRLAGIIRVQNSESQRKRSLTIFPVFWVCKSLKLLPGFKGTQNLGVYALKGPGFKGTQSLQGTQGILKMGMVPGLNPDIFNHIINYLHRCENTVFPDIIGDALFYRFSVCIWFPSRYQMRVWVGSF